LSDLVLGYLRPRFKAQVLGNVARDGGRREAMEGQY